MAARHFPIDNQGRVLGTQATLGPFRSTNLILLSITFLSKLAELRKVYVTPLDVGLNVWAIPLKAFLNLIEVVACGLVVEMMVLTCL